MQHGRYFRNKPKHLMGTPFDSTTELQFHNLYVDGSKTLTKTKALHFKGYKLPYTIEHEYNPDFTLETESGMIYVEIKGYFQDSSEAAKYKWVRASLDDNQELVFVFEDPGKSLHYLSKRKDGTKMSMSEWAEKNGFRWFTLESFKEVLT